VKAPELCEACEEAKPEVVVTAASLDSWEVLSIQYLCWTCAQKPAFALGRKP